jgi:2'-hydroxyisoflavone reductase
MKLLVIGGTKFLGRHLVESALAHNHEVTLFNRGTTPSPTLAGVETIQGDRNKDLDLLEGRSWDAVVDTCGYLPRTVRASAEALAGSVDRYVFISSVSVYAEVKTPGMNETAPLATLTAEQVEEANAIDSSGQTSAVTYGKMYGGLKALCEQTTNEVMPNRVLIIRPGLIVGPHDYTDRFTYWVSRVASGGETLAPGDPDRYLQFIDVRDLAEWIVRMVERNETGIYNATGLPGKVTMANVLDCCRTVSASDATFTWVTDDFLLNEKVRPWGEMPLWMPDKEAPNFKGFMFLNCDKAVGAGLNFRPLEETISATLNWQAATDKSEDLKAGIKKEKEEILLSKWRKSP